MPKQKRKQFWVNQPFQRRYTFQLLAVFLFFGVVTSGSVYFAIASGLRREFANERLEAEFAVLAKLKILEQSQLVQKPGFDPAIFESPDLVRNYQKRLLADILTRTNLYLLLALGCSLPLVVILSVFWSHRVVGPLTRILASIDRLREGDLSTEVRLRKQDELQVLAEDLTFIGRRFKEKLRALKEKVERLRKLQSSLENSIKDPKEASSTEFYVKSLARELGELSQAFQEFRTDISE